jgi:C-terminal processing protease CtpA/Prc
VIGGLVIVEINEDLMRGWKFIPPAVDLQRYEYRRTGIADTDRLLMVVSVLPDEINRGYEQSRFAVVKTVNGKSVSNLKQVREQLNKPDGDYVMLGMAPHDIQVTFSRKALAERMPVIASRYGLDEREKTSAPAPVSH